MSGFYDPFLTKSKFHVGNLAYWLTKEWSHFSMNSSASSFQYQDAINKVRAYIEDQKLSHGDRLPPEREFATMFGIGRPTVNKALACLISEGLLRRDGYKLYVAGSPLNPARSILIGVLCPHPLYRKQRVTHNLLEAAHDVCSLTKVRFIPMLSMDGLQQRTQLLEILKLNPDGVVIWPHPEHSYADLFQQIVARNTPLVVSDCNWGAFDFVGVDNFAGMRTILDHLAELGHRQIAYFTRALSNPNLEERLEGYRYTAARMFDDPSEKRVYRLPGDDETGLVDLLKKFCRKETGVTAICCSHDALAIEAMRLCLQSGIDVPEQLSVTGFDGIDAGETASRPLTTVAQNFYQLGSLAVDLLIRRIRMCHIKHASHIQQIHLTPRLVVRASSAAPAKSVSFRKIRFK